MEGSIVQPIFLTNLEIHNLRGLRDIEIEIDQDKVKHLILTGRNGSGKTSTLDAIANYLNFLCTDMFAGKYQEFADILENKEKENTLSGEEYAIQTRIKYINDRIESMQQGVEISLNIEKEAVLKQFINAQFIVAYYRVNRKFEANISEHVEKINLKDKYTIEELPRFEFIKFLLDMKTTEAMQARAGNIEKADEIATWFVQFEKVLATIFENEDIKLLFDAETFTFSLKLPEKPAFDFNTLSSGYGAVLDIVVDMMMRMQVKANRKFAFTMPGIVLIDEIEAHLHLELQKNILIILTTLFPNVQFILTTHSPFVLNSLEEVVIFDLENKVKVADGLNDVSYKGIVEGYFGIDDMSKNIIEKFKRYQRLVVKKQISNEEFIEIAKIQIELEEIPDFLSWEMTTEFERLKTEFEAREDL